MVIIVNIQLLNYKRGRGLGQGRGGRGGSIVQKHIQNIAWIIRGRIIFGET